MSLSFPKLLVDFGRQFLWSPLTTVTIKHRDRHHSQQIQSTFYCDGDTSIGGSVICLSEQHTPNQQTNSSENVTELLLNDCNNCLLNANNCTQTYISCEQSFDAKDKTDIQCIGVSDLKRVHRSLSEPNLQLNSAFSDSVGYQSLITDNTSGCALLREHDFSTKSVTSSSSTTASDISNCDSDEEIESSRNTNPYNRLLEEIDWFNTNSSAISAHSNTDSDDEDFVSQINNIITTELCHKYLTDETNDDKSISEGEDKPSVVGEHDSREYNLQKPSKKKNMNKSYINFEQIVEKQEQQNSSESVDKMQQNLIKTQIQTMSSNDSSTENVVLNDYFDNSGSNRCEPVDEGLPNRHLLSSDAAPDERKTVICSRNSRRLIVSDKRLRNAVLDRLKRLGRSQSQGRSDETIAANLSHNSRQFVLRTKGLYRNVKRRFSSVPPTSASVVDEEPPLLTTKTVQSISIDDSNMTTYSKINVNTMDRLVVNDCQIDAPMAPAVVLRHCSSFESIEDSGCGSSIQTSSLSTDSNRSSICTGDDMNGFYSSALLRGPFIGYAKAITDCTPCPYYKDALAFKRGDIISIISKDESGTWIGMTNGRIGHFKFVNVEEMKHFDHKRSKGVKMSHQLIPVTVEKEFESESIDDYYSICGSDEQLKNQKEWKIISEKLKSRLIECKEMPLTLNDINSIIGLSDLDLNLLSMCVYNDLKQFANIDNKDTLNKYGITDASVQHRVLNTTRLLREHYFNKTNNNINEQLIRPQNTSQQKCLPKLRRDLRCMSAPTTPAITPVIDFSSDHFLQLLSKLESVSTSSLENSCSFDGLQQELSDLNTITTEDKPIEKYNKSAKNITNNCENQRNERIYENNEQIIIATHEQQNSSTFDIKQQKTNSSDDRNGRPDISDSKPLKSRQNSVRFAIRDKSLDRNLLRKLDLKPIYMVSDKKSCDPCVRSTGGMTASQSVMDLRTNINNSSLNESTNNQNLTIDTLRGKKRFKKLMSNSRRFSSFQSHSSLMSLANNTGADDSTATKLCSNTLREAIDYKLKSENIDLTEEPYSDGAGFCGIPPALIQRYTDECQRDTYEVAEALDAIRMSALEGKGRRGIPNDYLGDSCVGPVIDVANYDSLHLWLISLGLPMYESCLKSNGYENLYRVSKLREVEIVNKCGIRDRRHVRILTNAIGALHLSFGEIDKT